MSENRTNQGGKLTSVTASEGSSVLMTEQGKTTIADTVVAKIAGIAICEISRVHTLGADASREVGAVGALGERIPPRLPRPTHAGYFSCAEASSKHVTGNTLMELLRHA